MNKNSLGFILGTGLILSVGIAIMAYYLALLFEPHFRQVRTWIVSAEIDATMVGILVFIGLTIYQLKKRHKH